VGISDSRWLARRHTAGAADQTGSQARRTALGHSAQAAPPYGVGTTPEIVDGLMPQPGGLQLGQIMQAGLEVGVRKGMEHGELREVERWNELY
jgi:hypothetical protein